MSSLSKDIAEAEYNLEKAKLDVSPKTVRVWIELDLVNGVHFNPNDNNLTPEQMKSEAILLFVDWLDTWCGEEKDTLIEYVQAKLV